MTGERKALFGVSSVAVVALAGFFWQLLHPKQHILDGQSPVKVMGGSISFYSERGWTVSKASGVVRSIKTDLGKPSSMILLDEDCTPGGVPVPINRPWRMTILAKKANAIDSGPSSSSENGVRICSNVLSDGSDCSLNPGDQVGSSVTIFREKQWGFMDDPPDSDGAIKHYQGVDDSQLGSSSNSPCKPKQKCEHMGRITLEIASGPSQTHSYNPQRFCKISIE